MRKAANPTRAKAQKTKYFWKKPTTEPMQSRPKLAAFRVTNHEKASIARLAGEDGLKESEWLRKHILAIVSAASEHAPAQPSDVRKITNTTVQAVISEDEKDALNKAIQAEGVSGSFFIGRAIRAALSASRLLSKDELRAIAAARVDLTKVAINLNQIARTANGGGGHVDQAVDMKYLAVLARHIKRLTEAIDSYMDDSRLRNVGGT